MRREHVVFFVWNQSLAKLAPMNRTIVKQWRGGRPLWETNHTVPRCTISGIAFH